MLFLILCHVYTILILNRGHVSINEDSICESNPCKPAFFFVLYDVKEIKYLGLTEGREAPPTCCCSFIWEGQPIRGKLAYKGGWP